MDPFGEKWISLLGEIKCWEEKEQLNSFEFEDWGFSNRLISKFPKGISETDVAKESWKDTAWMLDWAPREALSPWFSYREIVWFTI